MDKFSDGFIQKRDYNALMQTFLPYPDFRKSLECLDTKRLGKQRVEAFQLIKVNEFVLVNPTAKIAWKNHPAARMWRNYLDALKLYYNTAITVWCERGFKNSMAMQPLSDSTLLPPFISSEDFHASHRSNLLRKNYDHYKQFGWTEPLDLPYIWPEG